jgi:hypothetical protein
MDCMIRTNPPDVPEPDNQENIRCTWRSQISLIDTTYDIGKERRYAEADLKTLGSWSGAAEVIECGMELSILDALMLRWRRWRVSIPSSSGVYGRLRFNLCTKSRVQNHDHVPSLASESFITYVLLFPVLYSLITMTKTKREIFKKIRL